MKKYILISSGIIIFILLIIILIVNSSGSKPYREHNTAKRSLEESGQNYVKWEDRIYLQNQYVHENNKTYLDVCGFCNCKKCFDGAQPPQHKDSDCRKLNKFPCDAGCMCGKGSPYNPFDVSTAVETNPRNNSQTTTWIFGKKSSSNTSHTDYIVYGDLVYVLSWARCGESGVKDRDGNELPYFGYIETCGSCIGSQYRVRGEQDVGQQVYGCACRLDQNVFDVRLTRNVVLGENDRSPPSVDSEVWKIISATGIPEGRFVEYDADIYLENQDGSQPLGRDGVSKTFLDACGSCDGNMGQSLYNPGFACAGDSRSGKENNRCLDKKKLDVSTSYTPTRDGKSGTWKIIKSDDPDDICN